MAKIISPFLFICMPLLCRYTIYHIPAHVRARRNIKYFKPRFSVWSCISLPYFSMLFRFAVSLNSMSASLRSNILIDFGGVAAAIEHRSDLSVHRTVVFIDHRRFTSTIPLSKGCDNALGTFAPPASTL